MPFLRSQTREKKPRSPPQVLKGDPAKSMAPITVRITADVKPKPIVAEIQVSQAIHFEVERLNIAFRIRNCTGACSKYGNVFSPSVPFPLPSSQGLVFIEVARNLQDQCNSLTCSLLRHPPLLQPTRPPSSMSTRRRVWTSRLLLHLSLPRPHLQESQT